MTSQPMYYYQLTGYPPAPAAAVQIEMIHRDIAVTLRKSGWLFFSPDLPLSFVEDM